MARPVRRQLRRCAAALLGWGLLATPASADPARQTAPVPLGLPGLESLHGAPPNPSLAALGGKLFLDKRLSADGRVSCSSCHDPARAFTDGRTRAIGIKGHQGTRNAPSLFNVAYQGALFWDGRSPSLEAQARAPLTNRSEQGLADERQVVQILEGDPAYRSAFAEAFPGHGKRIGIEDVANALAEYERTLLAGNSPFDRYYFGGEKAAMPEAAVRGLALFQGRAACSTCHLIGEHDALFTDQKYHPSTTGLGAEVNADLPALAKKVLAARSSGGQAALDQMITDNPRIAALGRFNATQNPADIGQFKTPSLRNVALTAPYMHDGSIQNLPEVIETELYVRGAAMNYPIVLTQSEQQDLLAFLLALSSPVESSAAKATR